MGLRNYLIEGSSGTGKTTVATELQRRGYHVLHGDRELAYRGDPLTGAPLNDTAWRQGAEDPAFVHAHHLWDIGKVKAIIDDRNHAISFFCGGSRNIQRLIDLFDGAFVLEVDLATLKKRLDARQKDEFGGKPAERELILRLHVTKEDVPNNATGINATRPLAVVVDDLLGRCRIGP